MSYDKLFSPMKIGNVEIKNRIVLPPMGPGFSLDGVSFTKREAAYLIERAKGGMGLIITGGFSPCLELSGSSGINPTMGEQLTEDTLRELIEGVHKYDSKIMIQLLHEGRQSSSMANHGQQPVGPSAVREADFLEMPRELTNEEVHRLVQYYIDAAKRAYDLGADGVEIHGAHGYLVHQFMSPRANRRTDEYGGSFENRMRFITEIVNGINEIKPADRMLVIRINGADNLDYGMSDEASDNSDQASVVQGIMGVEYDSGADEPVQDDEDPKKGLSIEECIEIAKYLESIGVDALDVSNGTYSVIHLTIEAGSFEEGWRSFFIKPITENVDIPVIAVDNIKRAVTAEQLIEDGVCDFVSIGRTSIADPCWADKVRRGTGTERNCIGCLTCLDNVGAGGLMCAMNPYTGREVDYNEETMKVNGDGRLVVVVGGGPGGIQAALTARRRGFDVKLFEKSEILGGSLIPASKGYGKEKVAWSLQGMINELIETGAEIHLNEDAAIPEKIKAMNPYAIVIAAGAAPVRPPIEGLDSDIVLQAHDVLQNDMEFSDKRIVIIGSGMTGLETAEYLAAQGNKIVMYDMLDEIAKGANLTVKMLDMAYLASLGTEFRTGHKLLRVEGNTVYLENMTTGETVSDTADIIVLSLGVRPIKSIEETLSGCSEHVISVGDCSDDGGKIFKATRDGLLKVWDL